MPKLAENSPDYPFVVAQLDNQYRVIECATDLQWIVQKRHGKTRWTSLAFCHTKQALLRRTGDQHPALLALPDRYAEGHRKQGHSQFQPLPLAESPLTPENSSCPAPTAKAVAE